MRKTKTDDASISENRLVKKVKSSLRLVGREAVSQAFTLYYTLRAPDTPVWCRTVIIGSLSYFISMIDGIPDLTPFLGYTDDIAVMAAAIATLSSHITPEIKSKADEKTGQLLGD
jgi:uncharacterized membrane protein YkvA (DUF1232 family)